MNGGNVMAKTKKELAALVWRLFANIDEANQSLDMMGIFNHLDNAYLLYLVKELKDTVEQNIEWGQFLCDDEETLREALKEARKVLGEIEDED
jgi:hypothetical protein